MVSFAKCSHKWTFECFFITHLSRSHRRLWKQHGFPFERFSWQNWKWSSGRLVRKDQWNPSSKFRIFKSTNLLLKKCSTSTRFWRKHLDLWSPTENEPLWRFSCQETWFQKNDPFNRDFPSKRIKLIAIGMTSICSLSQSCVFKGLKVYISATFCLNITINITVNGYDCENVQFRLDTTCILVSMGTFPTAFKF